jgi:hypothetical protein
LIATELAKTFDGTVMDQPIAPPPLVINGKVVDESEIVY